MCLTRQDLQPCWLHGLYYLSCMGALGHADVLSSILQSDVGQMQSVHLRCIALQGLHEGNNRFNKQSVKRKWDLKLQYFVLSADLISPLEPWGEAVLPDSFLSRWLLFSATAPWWTPADGLYTTASPDHPPPPWYFLDNLVWSVAWGHEDLENKKRKKEERKSVIIQNIEEAFQFVKCVFGFLLLMVLIFTPKKLQLL